MLDVHIFTLFMVEYLHLIFNFVISCVVGGGVDSDGGGGGVDGGDGGGVYYMWPGVGVGGD